MIQFFLNNNIVNWVLMALGWIAVHKLAIRREKRGRIFEELKRLQASLNGIYRQRQSISNDYTDNHLMTILFGDFRNDFLNLIATYDNPYNSNSKDFRPDMKRDLSSAIINFRREITGDMRLAAELIPNQQDTANYQRLMAIIIELKKCFFR